jgi:hypothetical protein
MGGSLVIFSYITEGKEEEEEAGPHLYPTTHSFVYFFFLFLYY